MTNAQANTVVLTGNGMTSDLHMAWSLASCGAHISYVVPENSGSVATKVEHLFRHYGNADMSDHVSVVPCEILDYEALASTMAGAQYVVHAQEFHPEEIGNPEELWRRNVVGAQNVCYASLSLGVRRLVMVTPVVAMGTSSDGAPLSEASAYLPKDNRSDYERSLFRREMELFQAAERGLEVVSLLSGYAIGPFSPFEEEMNSLVGQAASAIRTGFVDARDLSDVVARLALEGAEASRMVCVGHNASYGEVFDILKQSPVRKRDMLWLKIFGMIHSSANDNAGRTYFSTENASFSSQTLTDLLGVKFRSLSESASNCQAFLNSGLCD